MTRIQPLAETTARVDCRIITDCGGQVFEKKKSCAAGKGTHTLRTRSLQQKRTLNIIGRQRQFSKLPVHFIFRLLILII